uniref:tRNA(Phe) (4-demethylwyosine(37)-C(7)) aminocarboxypropyltransferase n=1 Tax=Parascaris univalens TaxID=6257 RepID=A0A915BCV7_PARUN
HIHMCIVVKSHTHCWLQRDLRRLLSNVRRVQLIDPRFGISRAMASTGTTFCPPKQVQKMRELKDEDKLRFRKEVVLPAIMFPANLISRIVGCKTIFDFTIKKLSNRIKPIMDIPSTSNKYILFEPDLLNAEIRSQILDGFSQVGHIVHVNLREELLPYKLAIGRILLEKTNN